MNLIDLACFAFLALCMLCGYYRGFLSTLLNGAGALCSALLALLCYPLPAAAVKRAGKLIPAILNFSEAGDMIGSIETYRQSVSAMGEGEIAQQVELLALPTPLERLFAQNLRQRVYSAQGVEWFGDYLSHTIAEMAVHIASLLGLFLVFYLLFVLAERLIDYVVGLPQLKHGDSLAGVLLGFVHGVLLLGMLCCAIPAVMAFLPYDQLRLLVDGSHLCRLFYRDNLFLMLLKCHIGA